MTVLSEIRRGDVVRCPRFGASGGADLWLVATEQDDDRDYVDGTIIFVEKRSDVWFAGQETVIEDGEGAEIIPPDEVPDHVMAALMKLNLL